jgi:hypothetical protein
MIAKVQAQGDKEISSCTLLESLDKTFFVVNAKEGVFHKNVQGLEALEVLHKNVQGFDALEESVQELKSLEKKVNWRCTPWA